MPLPGVAPARQPAASLPGGGEGLLGTPLQGSASLNGEGWVPCSHLYTLSVEIKAAAGRPWVRPYSAHSSYWGVSGGSSQPPSPPR